MNTRTKFILHVEYSNHPREGPVYIQLSDGKTMFAECGARTLRAALTQAVDAMLKHEGGKD